MAWRRRCDAASRHRHTNEIQEDTNFLASSGALNQSVNVQPAGYGFWLDKLIQFNGDFLKAEMVKAFLLSSEYRQRFGP